MKEDGSELLLNPGKTWISIIGSSAQAGLVFESASGETKDGEFTPVKEAGASNDDSASDTSDDASSESAQ